MRRAGAIAAMLACVVYTMLATWHGALLQSAKAQASTPEALLEQSLKTAICHNVVEGQVSIPDAAPAQEEPGNPSSGCPVCKGLAACPLILLVAAELGLLAPTDAAVDFVWSDESASQRALITPRSRGPPLPV